MLYVHFTNLKDAMAIKKSKELWKSSYVDGTFAVAQGGFPSPSVQQSKLGRVSDRKVAVVFKTNVLPDVAYPEEVIWHLDKVPVEVVKVLNVRQLLDAGFLNESVAIDGEFDMLSIPLHPAFNEWDGWVRLPEGLKPWVPGRDNQKYKKAHALLSKGASVDELVKFWKSR